MGCVRLNEGMWSAIPSTECELINASACRCSWLLEEGGGSLNNNHETVYFSFYSVLEIDDENGLCLRKNTTYGMGMLRKIAKVVCTVLGSYVQA